MTPRRNPTDPEADVDSDHRTLTWRDLDAHVERLRGDIASRLTTEANERRDSERRLSELVASGTDALKEYLLLHSKVHELLDARGTEGFRETEAERRGREDATRELLTSQRMNRQWLVAVVAGVIVDLGLSLATIAGVVR